MHPDRKIKDMPMKEINDFIGLSLRGKLTGFVYRRTKKQLERKTKFKADVISWHCVKYGETLHLSFCRLVRHNEIDGLYENLFGMPQGKEFAVWNGFSGLGGTNGSNQYHIRSSEELESVLEQVSLYLREQAEIFYNQLITDNDFLQYLYQDKKIESYSEAFALKRVMLCRLTGKDIINDVHRYNLSCCQAPPSGTDFYLKRYKEGLRVLDEYYGGLELPLS